MQIKYGGFQPPTEDGPAYEFLKKLIAKNLTCKCGHKMEKDAKFCSNCGLPQNEALSYILTADEKNMLIYIIEQEEKNEGKPNYISIYDLRHIPFFDTILERFRSALQGLAKKGYITFKNDIATLNKPAP